jgi:DnaJ-class molecular chaperone
VDADAEPAAVRSAYREQVKEVHPDAEGGTEERFRKVNEAYERLQEE